MQLFNKPVMAQSIVRSLTVLLGFKQLSVIATILVCCTH